MSGKTKRSLASTTTRPANTETQPLFTSPAEVSRASSRISDDQFHVVTGELSSESKHVDNQYTEIEVSFFPTEQMPNTPQLENETEQYISANSQLTIPAMITFLALYHLPGEAIAHLLTIDIFSSTHGAQLTIYA